MWLRLTTKQGEILVNMNNASSIEQVNLANFYKSKIIFALTQYIFVKESVEEINNMIDKEIQFYAKLK
jgi:hypothetical protein